MEESDRVWESERYVHFILKGTRSVEIRYAKEIVARIERPGSDPIQVNQPTAEPDKPVGAPPSPLSSLSKQDSSGGKKGSETPQLPAVAAVDIDRRIIKESRGVKFFDPRRPQRYWAARNSRHNSVSAALEALAGIYGRPTTWVTAHMGEENDLGLIHASLLKAYDQERETPGAGIGTSPQEAFEIKRDGAPKSRTSEDGGKGEGAFSAAAKQPSSKEEIDPLQPLQNAPDGKARLPGNDANPPGRPPLSVKNHRGENFPEIPRGVPFYDPRRSEKYWVDETHRFNSLNDALKELAVFYGVSEAWIGDHLGKTNDLYQIHQSIRESLTSE